MIKLGDKVKDSLTGYEGIVVARADYLNGCVAFKVQPTKLKKDGSIAESEWLDEGRLTLTSKAPGGPQAYPPDMSP